MSIPYTYDANIIFIAFTDRMNPFTAMSEDEFIDRFRLRKTSMYDLIEEIRDHLPAPHDSRGNFIPSIL